MAEGRSRNPVLWAATAAGLGAVSVGLNLAGRRQRRRWEANPDPLQGRIPRFPDGDYHTVTMDDGARISIVHARGVTNGADRPVEVRAPVVLVHGLTANVDDWGPVAERLVARGFDVVGIDLRGHGRSTLGSDRFTPLRLSHDLAAVLEALDLRRAVLAGHSMGGMTVLALATGRPEVMAERVAGLALLSTSANLDQLRFRLTIPVGSQLSLAVPDLLDETVPVLGVAALSAFGERPSHFMLTQAVDSFQRCPPETRRAATAGLLRFSVADRLDGITVPTLVVCGTQDLVVPFGHSERLAESIAGARLVALPGAGHIIPWERPDHVADEIARLTAEAAAG
ncbi:MAG: alpha/beta hydrolase [Acidimicrobiales bacterium]